jgi:hypothetical protein
MASYTVVSRKVTIIEVAEEALQESIKDLMGLEWADGEVGEVMEHLNRALRELDAAKALVYRTEATDE